MKNKKGLIVLIVMVIVVVGTTIAYFTTNTTFNNEFDVATYKTVTKEEFVSPTNWKPGEEIPKTITTTNEGSIPAVVRVSYKETYVDSEGKEIAEADIPENAVIINFDNTDEWTKEGDYYYYNYILNPGETTSSFIKSVTLNPNIGEEKKCVKEGNKEVCESVDTNIQGGTYTLTMTKETIQADVYKDAWNTSVELPKVITYLNRQVDGEITTGDLIKIGRTEEFYVVSSDEDTTVLLAHYNLNVGNNIQEGEEGIQNSKAFGYNSDSTTKDSNGYYPGSIAFSSTNYWNGKVGTGLTYQGAYNDSDYPYVYDSNSNLYTYVENYKTKLAETGVTLRKVRLLTYQETKNLGCTGPSYTCTGAPSFVYESSYWLGNAGGNMGIWRIHLGGHFNYSGYNDSHFGVRPVVEINTSDIK